MRVIIFLSLLAVALGVPRSGTRIVGGEPTTAEQYPFIVNMQYIFFIWIPSCTATLITSRTALSATHCYSGDFPGDWRAVVGSSQYFGQDGTPHAISDIYSYADFQGPPYIRHDISIITLVEPVTFSSTVGVAHIAGPEYHLPDGTPLHVIGYGTVSYEGPVADQLQHVEVQQVNQENCREKYAYLKTQPGYNYISDVTPGMLCTGDTDVGSCDGDAGGPVVHNGNVLVGITSWGFRCVLQEYPDVNVRISSYTDWIVEHGSA